MCLGVCVCVYLEPPSLSVLHIIIYTLIHIQHVYNNNRIINERLIAAAAAACERLFWSLLQGKVTRTRTA